MHSGTHILRYDIFKDFQELGMEYDDETDYIIGSHFTDFAHGHINEWINKVDYVVVPMRHPARILQSFKKRGRRIHPSEPMPNPLEVPGTDFHSQWENLKYYHGIKKIHYIHIDDFDNRDAQVQKLGKLIDRELKPEWPLEEGKKSNSVHGTHALEVTQELEDQVPQWVLDFYYNEIVAGKPRQNNGQFVLQGFDDLVLPQETLKLIAQNSI